MNTELCFHGVGQGLFYSCSIKDDSCKTFNYVYDCGSESGGGFLNKEILGYTPNKIDFLAISHFHADHVNGIQKLLGERYAQKIYLPYFDARTYINVFESYLLLKGIHPQSELYQFLISAYYEERFPGSNSRVTFVRNDEVIEAVNATTFCFFNKKIDDEKAKILEIRIKWLLSSNSCESIEEYLKKAGSTDELKKIYEKVVGKNHNITSLILLHKSSDMQILLTGDAEFDDDLNNRISKHLINSQRTIIQVPHHGSKYNWRSLSEPIKRKTDQFVISCGSSNRHGHPHAEVVDDIVNNYHKELLFSYQGHSCIVK